MKIMNITQTINMKIFLKLENQVINNLLSQIIHIVNKIVQEAFQILTMKK